MDLAFLTASSSSCSASSMLPCRRSRLTLRRRIMASPRMHSSNVFRILLASSMLPATAGRCFRTGQTPELPSRTPHKRQGCPYPAAPRRLPTACAPWASWAGGWCRPCCTRASRPRCCGSPCIWHTRVGNRAETSQVKACICLQEHARTIKFFCLNPFSTFMEPLD